jgi:hypothetical protein
MMGTVGLPLPGVEMRLEGVPELGYLPSDTQAPRGEVGYTMRVALLLPFGLDQYGTNWLGQGVLNQAQQPN